jgi:general secretion pathway protein C
VETLFKKYFKVVRAAFVIVVALLLAAAITSFGASFLAPFTVTLPDGSADTSDPGDGDETFVADLPPGLFGFEEEAPTPPDPCAEVECDEGMMCDPATGSCIPEPEEEPEDTTADDDGRCIESDIAINLVGTQVAEDPAWSLAILHNPAIDRTQFAVIGTNLLAEAEVTRIERNRIFMQRNGREECLRYGDATERAQRSQGGDATGNATARTTSTTATERDTRTTTQTTAPTGQGGARPDTLEGRMQAGIRRNRDGSYDVQRDLIAEIANNQQVMEQQAPRVTPNYVNGQPRGFRLQGIRSGSMFSRIGIRNGDVIVAVGETQIDSPQRALELYDQMMQRPNVEVTVLRRGREHTINYNIR